MRTERDPQALRTLLDLSRRSLGVSPNRIPAVVRNGHHRRLFRQLVDQRPLLDLGRSRRGSGDHRSDDADWAASTSTASERHWVVDRRPARSIRSVPGGRCNGETRRSRRDSRRTRRCRRRRPRRAAMADDGEALLSVWKIGSSNPNSAPPPSPLAAHIRPFMALMSCMHTKSPIPAPLAVRSNAGER
jgi:hypothetical protein